jgi:hypothetical protein
MKLGETVGVPEESGTPAYGRPPTVPADKQMDGEGKEATTPRDGQKEEHRSDREEGQEVLQDGGTLLRRRARSEQCREES